MNIVQSLNVNRTKKIREERTHSCNGENNSHYCRYFVTQMIPVRSWPLFFTFLWAIECVCVRVPV